MDDIKALYPQNGIRQIDLLVLQFLSLF